MPALPKIAIVGGGPAGLTLAVILQRQSIPFTVFELDGALNQRNQGGSLDLHPKTGQLALREAGIWEVFAARSRPEADVLKVVQINGDVLWDGNGADRIEVKEEDKFNNRPEIDRPVLHELLVEAVKPESIVWGKKVQEVVPAGDGTYDLKFADGSVEKGFGVVVGSDGAWSKVRKLVTDEMPHYSGISAVELWANDVETKHPWISEFVGAGSMFCFAEGRAIQSQRQGDGSIRTLASVRQPETFLQDCGIDWTKPDAARREYAEKYFGDVGADLQRLIRESDDELITRALYMLPAGFRWNSRPGIALIGDAAHVMTPFAGVGVNAAMVDALALARRLIAYKDGAFGEDLAAALKDYDDDMFPRAEMFAKKTLHGLHGHFSADGGDALVKRVKSIVAQRQ